METFITTVSQISHWHFFRILQVDLEQHRQTAEQYLLKQWVNGSAMSVSNMIKMVEQHECTPYSHQKIRDIFSLNREVLINDIL